MEIKLIIPKAAKKHYEMAFKSDPYITYEDIIGDDNFCYLFIEDPITEDYEKIAEAAENYGWHEGWEGAIKHYGVKLDK